MSESSVRFSCFVIETTTHVQPGSALFRNKRLLLEKQIQVTGLDYDREYVRKCQEGVEKEGLEKLVSVHHASVYDFQGGPYDNAYFSGKLIVVQLFNLFSNKHVKSHATATY